MKRQLLDNSTVLAYVMASSMLQKGLLLMTSFEPYQAQEHKP